MALPQMFLSRETNGGGNGNGACFLDMNLTDPMSMHHPLVSMHSQQQVLAPAHSSDQSMCMVDADRVSFRNYGKAKMTTNAGSDEDEPTSFNEDCDMGQKNMSSPWQRMKWTDDMVMLLINVVMLVGGEDGSNNVDSAGDPNKRKSGILMQKKGKWKSTSQAMTERGCFVSPQQCEDKFNDLNKRYKRLNDILGKGICCSVVENPSLLETMDHLSAKAKEDVKKLLSSKHLFYKEMCSYHNGCKALAMSGFDSQSLVQARIAQRAREPVESTKCLKEDNYLPEKNVEDPKEQYEDSDDDDDDDEEDRMEAKGGEGGQLPLGKRRKISRVLDIGNLSENSGFRVMSNEARNLFMWHNGSWNKGIMGKQGQWIRVRALQVEEQRLQLQAQALELEKERFKWQRVSVKEELDAQREKLNIERSKVEKEHIALQQKQEELDIECKRSEASMASITLILEHLQSREQTELGRH